MPGLEGGLHALKADSSAGADDQDCRHGVDAPGQTRPLTVMGDTSGPYFTMIEFTLITVGAISDRGRS